MPSQSRSYYVLIMGRHESLMITYALDILREGISDGLGRPLTTAEKLACRVLLPILGKEQVTRFAAHLQGGNPMYRRGLLEGALEAMEREVAARGQAEGV